MSSYDLILKLIELLLEEKDKNYYLKKVKNSIILQKRVYTTYHCIYSFYKCLVMTGRGDCSQ